MTPERWQRIKPLLQSALERDRDERSAFLEAECAGDEALRKEVQSLIISHEQASKFIESPAVEVMADSLEDDQVVGRNLGPYVISARLGAGGMGEVYLAEDTRLGRKVALKMLPAYLTMEDERVRRFQQEARAASALNHPNIITIYEIGEIDSRHFMATEFIEGETLFDRLRAGLMKVSDALDVAVQVTSALCAAHQAGIVHRDIKPGNIMLRRDGIVKVLDFGLATLTEQKSDDLEAATLVKTKPGIVMGTAHYMSPEQARGQKMDARSDIFSLGIVIYEMLTGHVPFAGQTMTDVLASILMMETPSLSQSAPETPEDLHSIVHRTLRKDKEERYQTSAELLIDLKSLKQELEFEARRAMRLETVPGAVNKALPASRTKSRRSKAIDSLAILPLFNASSDPNTEYLSDGITDSIINNLSQLPKLRVMARSTVFRYQDSEIDPREVGRELNVRAVLTGRVQQLDDRIVISAELVDVTDGSQLWGEHYSRELSDIFGVQEEIARVISEKLRLKLTAAERKRLTKRSTESTEAYQLYLKGRFFWNKRTEEGLRQSIGYFQQAIEKDPAYASAYAGVSDSYTLLVVREAISAEEGFAKAKAAADMALKLDHDLSEAHASLGHALLHHWEWQTAEKELERAIALNPGYPSAHQWYSEQLTATGRFDESLKELKLAAELDPLSLVINADLGRAFYFARQYDQTIKQENKTLEMASNFWLSHINLGRSYTQKKMYAKAISELQTASELSPGNTEALSYLGFAYAAAGDRDKALQTLEDLEKQAQQGYVPPYHLAIIHTGLNQREQAFEWLERAYEAHAVDFFTLNVEPMFDQLRSDVRFADLVRRIGLALAPVGLPATSDPSALSPDNAAASPGILSSLTTASSAQTRRRSARSKAIDSLAVLPLVNASADPDMEYFSDGVTESIINALSRLPKLRVVARSTVFRYKGREVDPQQVGQELGVRAVLTGRVRQVGDGLTIAAELIDVTNDSQLWGERYTRELSDIFAVQEEIAKEISDKLRLKLTPAERKHLTKRATENTEAYQLYLKGRFFWNKRTEPGLRQSIEFFQEAIEKDPAYAAAYAGISDCYTILAVRHGASVESLGRAKAAAMKALEIDETLAEAHTALAHARLHDWEWAEAEKGIERALELNPADATAHNFFGEYLLAVERIDEAIVEIKKAQELDPLSLITTSVAAWTFYFARQYDQAIEETRKTLELDPDFFWARYRRGQAYERKGMFDEAIAELQRARQLSQGNKEISAALGHAYAVSGRRKEAQNILDQLREQSERGSGSAYDLGIIHAGFGENDEAFQCLEKAYQEHDSKIIHLKVDPRFDGLHSDPRFADLARRMGLPERQKFNSERDTVTPDPEGSTSSSVPLEQEIRFCTTVDGVRIAYATVGNGPPLVKAANWLNHLEFDWKSPIWRHVVEEFARDHLLVRYDERGNGLSDWNVENFSFEAFVQDLESVVEASGLDRFPILGISQGGPVAIAYAVRHPEKVSHLILYGSYARGWAKRGEAEDVERRQAQNKLIKLGWGQDNPAFRQLWSTQYVPEGTPEQWNWFNDLHRISTSPENAGRLELELGQIDVVDLLSQVKVPTLVLHCRNELQVPFEEGRLLAAKIPGARFVPLEGRNHLLLESEPAWPKFVTEVRRFLETEQPEAKPQWSQPPDSIERTKTGGQTTVGPANVQGIRTGEVEPAPVISNAEISPAPVTSSAEYVAGAIKRHKTVVAIIGAIVILLIAGLVYTSFTRVGRTIDSLAVLPFLNESGDPNTEYLSDGIAESIIYSTSQLPDLKVMPRSSVFRYKGKEIDPQTVGRELGVRAIMTGRVNQRGDDLSISAELVDLRENKVVWGKQYNRKIGDILAVQEEIARESSEKLRLLTTEEKKQLSKRYTENSEAYQLYLKGRYYWNKRTADGYQKGMDHFQQAIEKDPNYALAWTGLADSYMLFGRFGAVPPKESMPKAKYAATRALEIDDELAEAHTSLGYIKKEYDWDFKGAEAELKRAIQLNPNYPTAHFWYALYLAETFGRYDEALAKMDRAQELEPLSLIMSTDRGMILFLAHRYDQAIEQFRKTLEMEPKFFRAHFWLGRAYEQKGMYKEATEEFQKARQLDDRPFVLAALGHAFAASGRQGEAQKVLDELNQLSKRMYVDSYYVAAIHAALGETDQAFQLLEKAYDDRSTWLSRIKVDPIFTSLHSDPRFTNLVQRIGLP